MAATEAIAATRIHRLQRRNCSINLTRVYQAPLATTANRAPGVPEDAPPLSGRLTPGSGTETAGPSVRRVTRVERGRRATTVDYEEREGGREDPACRARPRRSGEAAR